MGAVLRQPETGYSRDVADLDLPQGLGHNQRCQVAVVGGGLTGVSAALELAERGYHVNLFEAKHIGYGCSGRNGGHLMRGMQGWPADFEVLARKLGPSLTQLIWEAGHEGIEIVKARVAGGQIDCDLKFGYVHAALHDTHMRELAQQRHSWEQQGYQDLTLLASRQELSKHVASDLYCGGLYDSGSGQIHPLRYLHGLTALALQAGVEVYEQAPAVQLCAGKQVSISICGHKVCCDHVLVCGNAYLTKLSTWRMRSRMATISSSMLATEALPHGLSRQILPSDATVIDCNSTRNWFRIDQQRRLIFGGRAVNTNLDPVVFCPILVQSMLTIFPQLGGIQVEAAWSGQVGTCADRLPHLGKNTTNVLFAQGYSGHGVAFANVAGRIMAEAVAGESDRLEQFSRLRHLPIPGWPLRESAVALALTWFRIRDAIKARL